MKTMKQQSEFSWRLDWFMIGKDVGQGRLISPLSFNCQSKNIIRESIDEFTWIVEVLERKVGEDTRRRWTDDIKHCHTLDRITRCRFCTKCKRQKYVEILGVSVGDRRSSDTRKDEDKARHYHANSRARTHCLVGHHQRTLCLPVAATRCYRYRATEHTCVAALSALACHH